MSLSILFDNQNIRNYCDDSQSWWFCTKDVCGALEIKNSRDVLARIDDKYKGVAFSDTLGGRQKLSFIHERGLYLLVMSSNKPEAQRFTEYVLDLIEQARRGEIITLKEHQAALEQQNLQLQGAVIKQAETIQVIESMFDTDGCMEMKDAVKVLKEYFCDEGATLVGRNKLFAFLRDSKVLMEDNLPYQRYAHHFVVNPSSGTVYLKNKSLVWLKQFVSKRVPKKASILQIAFAKKGFSFNDPDAND